MTGRFIDNIVCVGVVVGFLVAGIGSAVEKSDLINCSVEYAPGLYYQIQVDDKDVAEIRGPRMLWRGFASYSSNPMHDKWYVHFGQDYIEITKDHSGISVKFYGQNVERVCK